MDILASIEQPKEAQKAPIAPARPEENAEEKAKRERKESRRHLRVRWKDDSSLEEIRLFKHEQAEDEGRQDDMLRDAHDDRSEGMRLKQALEGVDVEGEDEEEEPFLNGEINIKARYHDLLKIDFSMLNDKSRKENFATRGGTVEFRTPAQEAQERREMMEMMAVYIDSSDIPSSPKEAPVNPTEEGATTRNFGQPHEDWVNQRLQEIWKFGPQQAMVIMQERESARKAREEHLSQVQASTQPKQENLSALLNQMHPTDQSNANIPSAKQLVMDATSIAFLEQICASLSSKPYPPTSPPDWMSAELKQDWYKGFNRDNAKKRAVEEQANAYTLSQQVVQPPPPQVQVPLIQNPFPPPAPPSNFHPSIPQPFAQQPGFDPASQFQQHPEWAAFMSAQMGVQQGLPIPPPPQQQHYQPIKARPQSQGLNYDDEEAAYPAGYDQQGIHSSRRGMYNDDSNLLTKKRKSKHDSASSSMNDIDEDDLGGDGIVDRYGRMIRNQTPVATMPPSEKEREYKGKKRPCKFWGEGKCAKGAACGFLHE